MVFFFLMIRRPPRSTLFPTRRSSDLFVAALIVRFVYADLIFKVDPQHTIDTQLIFSTLPGNGAEGVRDRKSTRLNSSHANISYAVFCLKNIMKIISTSLSPLSPQSPL